jgi:hypothetical protein
MVDNRMAKLRHACTPALPPEDLQNQIHSTLHDITSRLASRHGIPSIVADLLIDEVHNSILTIDDYFATPAFPAFGLRTHQRLVRQMGGFSDLLDHYRF